MSCIKLHKNDIGTAFTITLTTNEEPTDISAATTLNMIFGKPNGATSTQTASFVSDGTDGQLRYVTTSGFLDSIGTWSVQVYIQTPSGSWHSEIDTFKVERNIV